MNSRTTNPDGTDSAAQDGKGSGIYDYLAVRGSLVEKKKVLELQKEKRDLEECTFVPKINKKRAKTLRRNPSFEK